MVWRFVGVVHHMWYGAKERYPVDLAMLRFLYVRTRGTFGSTADVPHN